MNYQIILKINGQTMLETRTIYCNNIFVSKHIENKP